MADQLKWFKVWTSILSDDDFDPFREGTLADTGRWMRLGAYTALHGNSGSVEIMKDTLFRLLNVTDIGELTCKLMFKNVLFEEGKNRDGKITVTFHKWHKYQIDSTAALRMKTLRIKRRGEERRIRGDKKRIPPYPPQTDSELWQRFELFWSAYPKKVSKAVAARIWDDLRPSQELTQTMLAAIEQQKQSEQWKKDGGQFIPHPSTWLGQERWTDQPVTVCKKCNGKGVFTARGESGEYEMRCGCR
jgi:hypothetical protein